MFSVWDPRGLLLPFSIRSKIILQNLNRMKYGWDDELMEDDLRVWREWRREAAELDVVKIPRFLELQKCLKQLDEERIQNFCSPKEIEWKFQPLSAPRFGGV